MDPLMAFLILASFQDEKTAEKALWDLKMDQRGKQIKFKDAALLNRDKQNKFHIKETVDMSSGKGVLYGGVVGALVGLIAGPLGAAIGGVAGAVVGGLAAKKIDSGIPEARLQEIAAALRPGTAVIMVIVENRWLEPVCMRLGEAGGEVLSETLDEKWFEKIEEG
jgi:uncharacterized membrane protein